MMLDYLTKLFTDNSLELPEDIGDKLVEYVSSEVSPYEGKISTLEDSIIAKDNEIAELNDAIAKLKSHNYDLLMSIPSDNANESDDESDDDKEMTIDDLFEGEI